MMSLLQYLCPVKKADSDNDNTLSRDNTPPSALSEVDHDLVCLVEERGRRRGNYLKLSLKDKATIRKYASKHGVASAVKKFKKQNLKESSVRDWQDTYLKELKDRLKEAKPSAEVIVKELPSKKR